MKGAEVRADIPGTVAQFNVADGSQVEDGESVLEIECMKTLWPARATAAGIVRFQVTLGAMVAQDEVVAIIEIMLIRLTHTNAEAY